MTRIDDVAKKLDGWFIPAVSPEDLARALDDAGLIMPDLPAPEKYGESLYWGTVAEWHPDYGLAWTEDGMTFEADPQEMRKEAYDMLAAADYAQRNANDQ